MDVLRILGLVGMVAVALIVYYAVAVRCEEVHREKLLTAPAAYWMAAAAWLGYGGFHWRQELVASGGDVLNGTLVMGCAAVLAVVLLVSNFLRLRLFFGSVRTILQFLLLPLTVPLLPLYPMWVFFRRLAGPVPVRVIREE